MEKHSKIYVAGHKGMVGSAIVRGLEKQSYNNIIGRTHEELELTEQEQVDSFFEQEKPEYVFLAAALVGGIRANATYPADFLMQNLMLQNNIIQACKKYKVNKLMFLGSACIYPKECPQPMKEEYLLTGALEITNEPYSIAKIAGLKACYYFNKQYNTNFISVMPANCYGINDCFDPEKSHVIPALINKFHNAKINGLSEVILWGTGKPLREFLYVDDLAEACIYLMNNYHDNEFLNIGGNSEISIYELAKIIKNAVGYKGNIVLDTNKPDGMMRRSVDSTKINSMGWKSMTSLEDGLKQVYEWFLKEQI